MMQNKAIFKKKETKYMARIPQAEIPKAMKELSPTAFKLLMYYYSRKDGWRFSDELISKAIGSSARMIKKYKKELIDAKYLLIQKGEVDVYFVGQGAVKQFNDEIQQDDLIDEEPVEPIISKGRLPDE